MSNYMNDDEDIHATPTPILLSSPYQIGSQTNYSTQHTLIPPQNRLPTARNDKKQKRMNPYSPYPQSSSSTSSSFSDEYAKSKKSSSRNNQQSKKPKKAHHELLSEDQKRANHIASEQKRRANIRVGFESLVEIVPTLSTGHRSEALILQKSVEHLRQLIDNKTELKEKARELQLLLGEVPDEDSSEGELDYRF